MAEQRRGPLMVDVAGLELTPQDREILCHPMVGAVILFARNYADRSQVAALCREIKHLRRKPLLIAVDYEGGRVQRFRDGFTRIPAVHEIGDLYASDPDRARQLAEAAGVVIGGELTELSIDLPFAPVLDLDDGASEIIGDRAWHSDPQVVATLAESFIEGLRSAGLASTGKHFPGHGAVAEDSHLELPVDHRPLSQLLQRDLVPYKTLGSGMLDSVMMAHIVYPEIDDRPASLSHRWISGILRNDFGFKGVVVCDDLSMAGAVAFGDIVDRAEAALEAGCQLLPVCNDRASVEAALDGLGAEPDAGIDAALASLDRKPASMTETALDMSRSSLATVT